MPTHPKKEKENLENRKKLLEEIFELALLNDMKYFG